MATNEIDPTAPEQVFLRGLCNHVVSIAGLAVLIDPGTRRQIGAGRFFSISGFVASLYDRWFLITAGHVLNEMDDDIRSGRVRITNCHLADHFGNKVACDAPIPFDYVGSKRKAIEQFDMGLDIGFVSLSDHDRRLLEANGIVALPQDGWAHEEEEIDFDNFGVLGLPDELFSREQRIDVTGARIIGGVRVSLMMGNECDEKHPRFPNPAVPWLALAMRDKTEIKSMVGMSGGPVFGFKNRHGKPPLYAVVAVQSSWDSEKRVAFSTLLWPIIGLIDTEIRAFVASKEGK
jgi:hypothetical protein